MGMRENYDHAHNHPVNRALHMVAIPVGFSSLIFFWYRRPVIAVLLIVAAYALAWTGHWIEGNRPATFSNPFVFLAAPGWMLRRIFGRGEPQTTPEKENKAA